MKDNAALLTNKLLELASIVADIQKRLVILESGKVWIAYKRVDPTSGKDWVHGIMLRSQWDMIEDKTMVRISDNITELAAGELASKMNDLADENAGNS